MSILESLVTAIGSFFAIIVIASIFFGIAFGIGACLWPYAINTWLVYSGKPPQIEWWMGGLVGMVPGLGQSCIPVAFITFIAMLFIGG